MGIYRRRPAERQLGPSQSATTIGFIGFANAYLLTGDDRYLDIWRKQRQAINAQQKVVDGQKMFPRMYGDQGWYGYVPQPYSYNQLEIYFLSMNPSDRKFLENHGWLAFLDGRNPDYPEQVLRRDFARIRHQVAEMRADTTTPETRLADDPMQFNPASAYALLELMNGGIDPGRWTMPLHCRVRYFDPVRRRAGIPEDVAALVEKARRPECHAIAGEYKSGRTTHGHYSGGCVWRTPV